jgi:hypothetical protein
MANDETLLGISEKVKNFAVICKLPVTLVVLNAIELVARRC